MSGFHPTHDPDHGICRRCGLAEGQPGAYLDLPEPCGGGEREKKTTFDWDRPGGEVVEKLVRPPASPEAVVRLEWDDACKVSPVPVLLSPDPAVAGSGRSPSMSQDDAQGVASRESLSEAPRAPGSMLESVARGHENGTEVSLVKPGPEGWVPVSDHVHANEAELYGCARCNPPFAEAAAAEAQLAEVGRRDEARYQTVCAMLAKLVPIESALHKLAAEDASLGEAHGEMQRSIVGLNKWCRAREDAT